MNWLIIMCMLCYLMMLDILEDCAVKFINDLKFRTQVVCQTGLGKQSRSRSDCLRSSLIRVFPVCYSDKHFVNFSPGNQHFI